MLIEAKLSDATRSNSMYYFQEKLKVTKCLQLVMNLE